MPLFLVEYGKFLTRTCLVSETCRALNKAGIDDKSYCGHSLRIGAAMTTVVNGIEDTDTGEMEKHHRCGVCVDPKRPTDPVLTIVVNKKIIIMKK